MSLRTSRTKRIWKTSRAGPTTRLECGVLGCGEAASDSFCRRVADETPHHGPSHLSTAQHGADAEPWTVQHLCTRATTRDHAFGMFPKPVTKTAAGAC